MMVLFHFFYDLILFDFVDIDQKAWSWKIWPKVIITLFLICMGMNLRLAHGKNIKFKSLIKRSLKLAALAIAISIATYIIFPSNWIYFGILHFVAVASFLSLPFMRVPRVALLLATIIIIPSAIFGYKYPFISLSHLPVDHVPILPWLGCVFIGFFLQSINFHQITIPDYRGKHFVNLLGKYSLEIYVSHQAILFPLIYLLSLVLN